MKKKFFRKQKQRQRLLRKLSRKKASQRSRSLLNRMIKMLKEKNSRKKVVLPMKRTRRTLRMKRQRRLGMQWWLIQ